MLARSVGKDRLPEATGEKHFPIKELAAAVQASYLKAPPLLCLETEYWLCVFGSEYTIEHLPALKNSLEKGRKKMKKEEDRDDENFCSSIFELRYSILRVCFQPEHRL